MALTAKFIADFSSFTDAVNKAEVQLKSFETGANKVEKSLTRMTDAVSGRKVVSEATLMAKAIENVGGVTKLTASELQRFGAQAQEAIAKMKAIGVDVPKNVQGIADAAKNATSWFGKMGSALQTATGLLGGLGISVGVGAIVSAGKAALDYADTLTKLADKTGISTTALQRLQAVAGPSGNTLEDVVSAVNKFQKNITTGNVDALLAITKLGLSFDALKKLSPDEQFFQIAKAIQSIKDPAEQTTIAMQLFGKGGAEVLPTLKADVDKLKDSTFQMSEESVKALDDLGDAFGRWGSSSINVMGEVLGEILNFEKKAAESFERQKRNQPKSRAEQAQDRARFGGFVGPEQDLSGTLAPPSAPKLDRGQFDLSDVIGKTSASLKQLDETGATTQTQLAADFKAIADALKKFNDNLHFVMETSKGYGVVLDTLDGKVLEGIRYYVDRGVALDKLVTLYGLTAEQADALNKQLAFEKSVVDATTKAFQHLGQVALPTVTSLADVLKDLNEHPINIGQIALPKGGSSLTGALEHEKQQAADLQSAIHGIADAFALMAQIGGDSFGGIAKAVGGVISQINLAQQAAKAFGVDMTSAAATTTLGFATAALSVISYLGQAQANHERLREQLRIFKADAIDDYGAATLALGDYGTQLLQAIQNAHNLHDAQRAVNDLMEATQHQQAISDEANAEFGPSQSELDKRVAHAKELLDFVNKARQTKGPNGESDFTPEQQAKAYFAWQKAMADAGNQAAKEWVKAHEAADGAAKSTNAAIDALVAKRDGLAQSVAAEAPEAVMGVIEAQTRGQIAVLDKQIQEQQAALDKASGESKDTITDDMKTAADDVADQFKDAAGKMKSDLVIAGREGRDGIAGEFDGFSITIPVHFKNDEFSGVPGAATGGRVTVDGVQHFTNGGRVLPFVPRGTDTVPAMLTPGEIILNAAQQGRIASAMRGSVQIGALNVSVQAAPGDDPKALGDKLIEAIRSYTPLYDAIGTVAQRRVG